MKRFAQQFKKQSDKIKLNAEEQFLLREKITTFMEYHPLPTAGKESETISLDTVFTRAPASWKKWRMSFGVVAVAFLMTLPVVAEHTVPGDILYPVKVKINEEVRSTLARTPYEKVEWESKRIERRISEARVLAKAGLLTPEAEEAVVVAVTQHRSNADAEIALLRESNNTDEVALANMTLASVFEVQSTAFEFEKEETLTIAVATSPETAARTLASVIEGERAELARLNETDTISYERLMAEIEKQTTRAYERLASIKNALSVQESADVTRRLNDIATKITEARDQKSEGDIEQLRQALKDTQKLISFMNDIDLRSTVAVERIVPITPTFEERLQQFTPRFKQLIAEAEKIEEVIEQLSDDITVEEVTSLLEEIEAYSQKVQTVTPQTIRDVETNSSVLEERVRTVLEMMTTLGIDFTARTETETEIEFGLEGATSSPATSTTTTKPVLSQ